MRALFPKSLLGQVLLALAIGLLVAQSISAALLYRAAEQRRDAGIANAIAFRIIAHESRAERAPLVAPQPSATAPPRTWLR